MFCAAARFSKLTTVNTLAKHWFHVPTIKGTYEGAFYPVRDNSLWEADPGLQVVLPPLIVKRQAGRPRKKDRIRSTGEEPRRTGCGRCGAFGHTRHTCKAALIRKNDTRPKSLEGARSGNKRARTEAVSTSTSNNYTNPADHNNHQELVYHPHPVEHTTQHNEAPTTQPNNLSQWLTPTDFMNS